MDQPAFMSQSHLGARDQIQEQNPHPQEKAARLRFGRKNTVAS